MMYGLFPLKYWFYTTLSYMLISCSKTNTVANVDLFEVHMYLCVMYQLQLWHKTVDRQVGAIASHQKTIECDLVEIIDSGCEMMSQLLHSIKQQFY